MLTSPAFFAGFSRFIMFSFGSLGRLGLHMHFFTGGWAGRGDTGRRPRRARRWEVMYSRGVFVNFHSCCTVRVGSSWMAGISRLWWFVLRALPKNGTLRALDVSPSLASQISPVAPIVPGPEHCFFLVSRSPFVFVLAFPLPPYSRCSGLGLASACWRSCWVARLSCEFTTKLSLTSLLVQPLRGLAGHKTYP